MEIREMSPYIRFAADLTMPLRWQLRERVIFDYELLYVKEGRICVTVEDERYDGMPGHLFLFRPRQRHSIRMAANSGVSLRQPHVHFDLYDRADSRQVPICFHLPEQLQPEERRWFREDVLVASPWKLPVRMRLALPLPVEELMMAIIDEYAQKQPGWEIGSKGLLLQLLALLAREQVASRQPGKMSGEAQLGEIRRYLQHHVADKITLDQLADLFKISKYYLVARFKKAYGQSPIQYQQGQRIERAKERLQYTDLPIGAIADDLGYPDIQSFSRAFKAQTGQAPTRYRSGK